jgi:hypothetical protein
MAMSTDAEDLIFMALPKEIVFQIIDALKIARDDEDTCEDCNHDYTMIISMLLTVMDKDTDIPEDWVDKLNDWLTS